MTSGNVTANNENTITKMSIDYYFVNEQTGKRLHIGKSSPTFCFEFDVQAFEVWQTNQDERWEMIKPFYQRCEENKQRFHTGFAEAIPHLFEKDVLDLLGTPGYHIVEISGKEHTRETFVASSELYSGKPDYATYFHGTGENLNIYSYRKQFAIGQFRIAQSPPDWK